ncbi:hypothetical protein EDB85DRAFT_1392778 [Lactarius pseudohatsudake]|nr:hypothetical protein EDB85DRAFT_1392778 [Lactarius pseudohatsudake]
MRAVPSYRAAPAPTRQMVQRLAPPSYVASGLLTTEDVEASAAAAAADVDSSGGSIVAVATAHQDSNRRLLNFTTKTTLLEQFQRDDNTGTLLVAVHDAFDFASQEDRFKAIRRDSKQAQILTLMLQHVCSCYGFIRSYANDLRLWKRILKNTGGQVDK